MSCTNCNPPVNFPTLGCTNCTNTCPTVIDTDCVIYNGALVPCTTIKPNTSLTDIIKGLSKFNFTLTSNSIEIVDTVNTQGCRVINIETQNNCNSTCQDLEFVDLDGQVIAVNANTLDGGYSNADSVGFCLRSCNEVVFKGVMALISNKIPEGHYGVTLIGVLPSHARPSKDKFFPQRGVNDPNTPSGGFFNYIIVRENGDIELVYDSAILSRLPHLFFSFDGISYFI